MKVLLNDNVNKELIEYLLIQEGILEVNLNEVDMFIEVEIKHNENTTPNIIMKYIELYLNNNFSNLIAFNKNKKIKTKKLKYTVEDICCEYCYMGFVREAFEKKEIISLKSDFDLYETNMEVKLEIEYDEKYSEEELIKFIKENA